MKPSLKEFNLNLKDLRNLSTTDSYEGAVKDMLNATGCGFCLAKWTQVTMHLGNGLTHSCHHPVPHKIPLDELKTNPSALHNTIFKKEQRKKMLAGERPAECEYCWRVEDNSTQYSDRIQKSLAKYSIIDHDEIVKMSGDEDVFPRYLEVSFNRTCNLKCAYCGPDFSSKWAEEISEHGVYDLPHFLGYNWTDNTTILHKEDNPYTEAFWKWWPEAKKHLIVLRITGGEPLLSKNTFMVLESLKNSPEPELELSINTNGNPPDKIWKKFVDIIKYLIDNKCIKSFTLFTSAEAYGKQCEYIRYGLDFDKFTKNINYFLKNTENTRLVFMAAFNILSLPSFKDFLKFVLSLKLQFNHNGYYPWLESMNVNAVDAILGPKLAAHDIDVDVEDFTTRKNKSPVLFSRVGIDIPYVRNPDFLDAQLATKNLVQAHMIDSLNFVYSNMASADWYDCMGFEVWEASKLRRIFDMQMTRVNKNDNADGTSADETTSKSRDRFYQFINEYDKRRSTNFLETFPELKEFYIVCKMENEKQKQETDKRRDANLLKLFDKISSSIGSQKGD